MRRLRSFLAWPASILVFVFMILFLLVVSPFRQPRKWDGFGKLLARALVRAFGMEVEVEGLGHVDPGRARIYVCNHVNILDGFLVEGHLPCFLRILDQAQHFSWPLYGWFSRSYGNISLDQGGGGRTAGGLRAADAALRSGASLLMFPEGHRSLDGGFLDFHRGAFRLAGRNGVDLVPIVQIGSWEVVHKGGGAVRPGPVRLLVLAPWTAERRKGMTEEMFRTAVREEMLAAYEAGRREMLTRAR